MEYQREKYDCLANRLQSKLITAEAEKLNALAAAGPVVGSLRPLCPMNLLKMLQLMLRERLQRLLPHLANHSAFPKESLTLTSSSGIAKTSTDSSLKYTRS